MSVDWTMLARKWSTPRLLHKRIKRYLHYHSNEIDSKIVDKVFQENRRSGSLPFNRFKKANVDTLKQGTTNTDSFQILEESLMKFRSNSPINFRYYLRNLTHLTDFRQLPYGFGDNQKTFNSKEMESYLKSLLWQFRAPIRFAFGYGSGVFSQGENARTKVPPQIDLNFAVNYPSHWHSLNMAQFPKHYSGARYLSSSFVSLLQSLGAGVYFNPFVRMDPNSPHQMVKYGVSSMDTLSSDLINWDSMYLAGRLHKPVAIIRSSPDICLLNQFNLVNAIKLALLLRSTKCSTLSEVELYKTITCLSYLGDPRMAFKGENPEKVANIVINQFSQFRRMYLPLLTNYFNKIVVSAENAADFHSLSDEQIMQFKSPFKFEISLSDEVRAGFISDLPLSFRKRLYNKYASKYGNELEKDVIAKAVLSPSSAPQQDPKHIPFWELQKVTRDDLANVPIKDYEFLSTSLRVRDSAFVKSVSQDKDLYHNLVECAKETVWRPSLVQSAKGILTAGFVNGVRYALEKRRKYYKGISLKK